MDIKISVVLPVYNVADYLRKCLDSLVNQTFEDFEVICINDGSTDLSLGILEGYALTDSRFKIITQENKGLSGARNTGMKNASGDYFIFIDSDDWVSPDCLEKLYKNAIENDSQIVQYDLKFFNEDTKEYSDYNSLDLTTLENIDLNSFNVWDLGGNLFKLPHNAVNKLYKASFLKEINAEFKEGIYYEDLQFFYKYYPMATKISYLKESLYFYRIRDESITTGGGVKSFDIFDVLDETKENLFKIDFLNDYRKEFALFVIVNLKFVYTRLYDDFKDEFIQKMKDKYSFYLLDEVKSFDGWHHSDQAFYQSILESENYREFKLCNDKISYKILAKHYKTLSDIYKQQLDQLTAEINELKNKNNRSRFRDFVKL